MIETLNLQNSSKNLMLCVDLSDMGHQILNEWQNVIESIIKKRIFL